jgi:hypothetical protein
MHIFREFNTYVGILSKEGLSFTENILVVEEFSNGELLSKRERNFIDM